MHSPDPSVDNAAEVNTGRDQRHRRRRHSLDLRDELKGGLIHVLKATGLLILYRAIIDEGERNIGGSIVQGGRAEQRPVELPDAGLLVGGRGPLRLPRLVGGYAGPLGDFLPLEVAPSRHMGAQWRRCVNAASEACVLGIQHAFGPARPAQTGGGCHRQGVGRRREKRNRHNERAKRVS